MLGAIFIPFEYLDGSDILLSVFIVVIIATAIYFIISFVIRKLNHRVEADTEAEKKLNLARELDILSARLVDCDQTIREYSKYLKKRVLDRD